MSSPEFLLYFTDVIVNLNTSSDHPRSRGRIATYLPRLHEYCAKHGISTGELIGLSKAATSGVFDPYVSNKLVSCLYAREPIPDSVVLDVVCTIASNRVCKKVQASLLRWLVLVHPYLKSTEVLHQVYGIIFQFLERPHLCVSTCRLLFWISQRSHVVPYRVSRLLLLQMKTDDSDTLMAVKGLLSIYKLLYPSRVSADVCLPAKPWFQLTHEEGAWLSLIREYQSKCNSQTHACGDVPVCGEGLLSRDGSIATSPPSQSRKRRHDEITNGSLSNLNSHQPSPVAVSPPARISSTDGKRDLTWFSRLLPTFVKIPVSAQLADVFDESDHDYVLFCTRDPVMLCRLTASIDRFLFSECLSASHEQRSSTESGRQVLQSLIQLTKLLVEPIPSVESFLEQMLPSWNGQMYRDEILELISLVGIRPFEELKTKYLDPLHRLYVSGSVHDKAKIILCWSRMLVHFIKLDFPRHKSNDVATPAEVTFRMTLFPRRDLPDSFNANDTIARLIAYADLAFPDGLWAARNHPIVQQAVLRFYYHVSALCMVEGLHYIPFPSPTTAYCLLLSHNAATITNVCQLLADLFGSMSILLRQGWRVVAPWQEKYKVRQVFNRLVLDVVSMLFKGDLFPPNADHGDGPKSVFVLPSKSLFMLNVHGQPPSKSLTLFNNIAFQGAAISYRLQETAAASSASPKQTQRDNHSGQYVAYLVEQKLAGVGEFQKVFFGPRKTPA